MGILNTAIWAGFAEGKTRLSTICQWLLTINYPQWYTLFNGNLIAFLAP
jgi:hypothetical protein